MIALTCYTKRGGMSGSSRIIWNSSVDKMLHRDNLTPILVSRDCFEKFPVDGVHPDSDLVPTSEPIGQTDLPSRDLFWKEIVCGEGPQINHVFIGRMIVYLQNRSFRDSTGTSKRGLINNFLKFDLQFSNRSNVPISDFFDTVDKLQETVATIQKKLNGTSPGRFLLEQSIRRNEHLWSQHNGRIQIWDYDQREIEHMERALRSKDYLRAVGFAQKGLITKSFLEFIYGVKKNTYDGMRRDGIEDKKPQIRSILGL